MVVLKQILKRYLSNIREIRTKTLCMKIHYIQCDIYTRPCRHNLHLKNSLEHCCNLLQYYNSNLKEKKTNFGTKYRDDYLPPICNRRNNHVAIIFPFFASRIPSQVLGKSRKHKRTTLNFLTQLDVKTLHLT